MQWLVTFTTDYGKTEQTQVITASTYTKAYVIAMGENIIVIDIKLI